MEWFTLEPSEFRLWVVDRIRNFIKLLCENKGSIIWDSQVQAADFSQRHGAHCHDRVEVFMGITGSSRLLGTSLDLEVKENCLCLIQPGVIHREVVAEPTSSFSNLVFMPHEHGLGVHRAFAKEQYPIVSEIAFAVSPSMQTSMKWLEQIYLPQSEGWASEMQSIGLAIAALSHWADLLSSPTKASQKVSLRIHQIRELMRDNLADPELSVKMLARCLHCSADYLSNTYRKETGERLNSTIRRERMSMAKHLLATTSEPIALVGRECGYTDTSFFCRLFKETTGKTPKNYRDGKEL